MPLESNPCLTWKSNFGSASQCAPQTPGVDHNMVWIGGDDIGTRTLIPAVAGDATTGIITDFTKDTGKQGYGFFSQEDSVNPQSGMAVNDNGGRDLTENITGRGRISHTNYTFMEKNLNLWGYLFIKDNDGEIWAWYVKLLNFNADWGTVQGDQKAITYTYNNTKRTRVYKVDLSVVGSYADAAAFFTYLTTA